MFNGREEIQIYEEYWLLNIEDKKDVPTSIVNKLAFKKLKSTGNPFKSTDNPNKSTDNSQSKVNKSKVNKSNNIVANSNLANDSDIYKSIIFYLNENASTNFKSDNKSTRTLIHARLADGFILDDFKTVIDNKVADWLNNVEMSQYLRPQTLFGTKFESYLNAKSKAVKHEHNDADDVF